MESVQKPSPTTYTSTSSAVVTAAEPAKTQSSTTTDTISSAQPVASAGFFSSLFKAVGSVTTTAVAAGSSMMGFLRAPVIEVSSDEDEPVPASVKAKPSTPEALPVKERNLPDDFFEKVVTLVDPKQKGKLPENAKELYLSQAADNYERFMNGPTLRTRGNLSKEDRAIRFAAESLSRDLRRIKTEKPQE